MIYKKRLLSLMFTDAFFIMSAGVGALLLKSGGQASFGYIYDFKITLILAITVNLVLLFYSGLYKKIWKYATVEELISVFKILTLGSITVVIINELIFQRSIPLIAYFIGWSLKVILIIGSRLVWIIRQESYAKKQPHHRNALIVGAGAAAGLVVKELIASKESEIYPIGFVDDDPAKQRLEAHGFPVLGECKDIASIVSQYNVDEVIIAIPSAKKEETKRILNYCKESGAKLKILPGVYSLITGKVEVKRLRDVDVEDVLGREPVRINLEEIAGYLKEQVVLVTGAGGSIGSELCRQAAKFNPEKLILLGHGENSIYDIELELRDNYPKLHLETEICDIKDKRKVNYIFSKHNPQVVFHAAAHKHVPLMERNPEEAVKNNVLGTKNVAEASDRFGVKTFVLISTDKAVNPTSVMGATKRVAEMVIQTLDKVSQTKFVAVRFGNVLGSRGSVIPIFKKQIAKGGPVTITHPDMVRYFMTIPEAVQLVIQAGSMANGGEVFVLDMGEPVKISDLAKDLIRLSGFEPNEDIKIKYIGIRPGEKLYEELLTNEEGTTSTRHERIFVAKPNGINVPLLNEFTETISNHFVNYSNSMLLIDYLGKLIPNFNPQNPAFHEKMLENKDKVSS